MAAALFDTLAFAKKLTDAGFTQPQAETVASAMHDIALSELVTKSDLREAVSDVTIRLGVIVGGLVTISTAVLAVVFG